MYKRMLLRVDYDHMGEAINLVENFKVEKVRFNCGEFNDLGKDLIEISKECYLYEAYKKYFSFDLDEERKSLKLVRKKIYTP